MNSMMLERRLLTAVGLLALAILVVAACMPVQPVSEEAMPAAEEANIEAAINGIWREYESSLNEGDGQRWIALWADGGIQFPPGEMPIEGKAQIQASNDAWLEQFDVSDFAIELHEARAEGGWAYARGLYHFNMTPKAGGDAVVLDGKYMTIFQQQPDGSWKIYRDLFNFNE